MISALVETKFRVPSRRASAVARPRLVERLRVATRSPLTVLSAPAGFGKTTVLVEWLASIPDRAPSVAWLSLDGRDNDGVLFWTYVVTAMRTAVDGFGEQALELLASSSRSAETALAGLLNEVNGLPDDLFLVLDDYHVIDAPEVHDGMRFVLEHQPAQLHLILATRADPPLPLGRMRARGQLLEIRAADLRFTAEESAAYLNGAMGLTLSESDVATLDGRTEGWIAALQLAALSMQGRSDVSAFIANFAGDDRHIVDYLAEEVLTQQSAEVRDFLLRTSILDRLTGPLCDAVTGQTRGKATLVALERANLFLVPLDDRRQWYRYHHLFADVLHAHLLDEHPGEVADLHRRASGWFESQGGTPRAIRHALAGGDPGRAANLIELAIPVMRRERREAELTRWMRCLPDDELRVRPVLQVALAGALAQVSEFDTVGERLSDIERSVCREDGSWPTVPPPGLVVVDETEFRSLPARVGIYRAAMTLADGDLSGTFSHARTALSLAPPDDDLTRAAAGGLAGLASWTIGDLSGAHAAFTETVAGLVSIGFLPDVLGCCITLGDIRRTQGRLADALRTYQWALELAAQAPGTESLRGTADMHVAIAAVLVERDDLTTAAEHLRASEHLGESKGLPQNPYRWRVVLARLRQAEGDLGSALELLDDAERVYAGDYLPNVRPIPAVRARVRLRCGELSYAETWARERELSADDDPSYLREYEHITLARLLMARHDIRRDRAALHQALALLQRLQDAAEEGGRTGSVLELLVLQALAYQARGELPRALGVLRRAVKLAEPEGYARIFAEEGPRMAALLKALNKQDTVATSYLRNLLATTTRSRTPAPSPQQLVDPLSDRELDVLRLLGTDLDGPEMARQLSVSLNTLRTHTKKIYAKLGVTSRRAAVSRARQLDLLAGQPTR